MPSDENYKPPIILGLSMLPLIVVFCIGVKSSYLAYDTVYEANTVFEVSVVMASFIVMVCGGFYADHMRNKR